MYDSGKREQQKLVIDLRTDRIPLSLDPTSANVSEGVKEKQQRKVNSSNSSFEEREEGQAEREDRGPTLAGRV